MTRIVKFPVTAPAKLGPRRVRRIRRKDPEDFGQLNLFDQSRVISFPQGGNYFEEALGCDGIDDDRAIELYEKAIEENQSRKDAYCNLGIIMSSREELSRAVDYLTRCLKEDPRHFEAHYNLANVYSEKGSYELAKMHYEIAIEIEPAFPNSHYNLGLVYISMKKYKEAINSIDHYVSLSPEHDHSVATELIKTLNAIAQ